MTELDRIDWVQLADWDRSAHLCDVGLPGHRVTVAVTCTGDTALWLVDMAELRAEHPQQGNADQRHEQLGPLPAVFRERIWQIPRCGQPTKDGRPCRARVTRAGDHCLWHRDVGADRQTAS